MSCCEFCFDEFRPRPQARKPRACGKSKCQTLRQRANEIEWRQRNPGYPGREYYEANKNRRREYISNTVQAILKCLDTGRKLFGIEILMKEFSVILQEALTDLGVRRINKFWSSEIASDLNSLDQANNLNFLPTS